MTVSVGRIREDSVLHIKLVAMAHNTIRGAAGGSILNAELLDLEVAVVARARHAAATYDVRRWPEFLGKPNPEWDRPGETLAFYGVKSEAELERAQAVVADVDMLGLISKDDPPVFMFSSQPDGALANRGHLLHHPNHARAVKKACDAVGVPATVWFAMTEPRIDGDH